MDGVWVDWDIRMLRFSYHQSCLVNVTRRFQRSQAYASLLGFISVVSSYSLSKLVTRHLIIVLLASWAVYVYRDLWPLATFTLEPLDAAEGALLWAKISVLTLSAVIIPLVVPRQYVPVDPKVCTFLQR